MSDELEALIEQFRHYRMSDAESEAQRISFAFGNVALSDPRVTREDVIRAALCEKSPQHARAKQIAQPCILSV